MLNLQVGSYMSTRTVGVMVLLAGMAHATGCAITGPSGQAEIDTWVGASRGELLQAYGTPSETIDQGNGNTVVEFEHSRLDSSTPYYCTVRYLLDAEGVVQSGTAEGNIGGCNHLIKVRQTTP